MTEEEYLLLCAKFKKQADMRRLKDLYISPEVMKDIENWPEYKEQKDVNDNN